MMWINIKQTFHLNCINKSQSFILFIKCFSMVSNKQHEKLLVNILNTNINIGKSSLIPEKNSMYSFYREEKINSLFTATFGQLIHLI